MPVISFNDSDKLAAVKIEPGWTTAIATEITQRISKSGKSTNFWTTFKVIDGKFAGKEMSCCFNTETRDPSMLGKTYFRPYSDLLLMEAAINKRLNKDNLLDISAVPLTFDTDDLLHKPFSVEAALILAEGDMVNIPKNFLPEGMGIQVANQLF